MKPFHPHTLVLLSLCLLLCLASKEQLNVPGYNVVNYNGDNALPQNSVNDMAFDYNGFLWLATEMGMVRFDGKNFREYNMYNTPALYNNRCNLVHSIKGKLLLEPDFGSHRILTVTADYRIKEDSLLSARPYQTHLHNNCIFYYDHIYKKWGGDSAAFKGLLYKLDFNGDLLTLNDRQAYVRKDSEYYYLDDRKAAIYPLSDIEGHALKIQFMVGDVYCYIDRQNNFYAFKDGHWQKNITCNPLLMEIFRGAQSGPYPTQYTVNALRDVSHTFLVYKKNILVLKMHNGLLDFDVLAANTGIRDISCMIYDDVYRTLYIGTATNGLYILKKHAFDQLAFTGDNYAINSLYAQLELSNNRILTGSGILDRNKAVNTPTPGLYDRMAFLRASDGNIWYSNFHYFKKIDTSLRHPVSLQYLGFWPTCIIETSDKSIMYCGSHQLFRHKGNEFTTLLQLNPLFHGADLEVLNEINPNDIWIGSQSGLFSYDLIDHKLRRLPGFDSASVRTIYKARDGSIWIGTYGQGFYKYVNGKPFKMPIDRGNNLATVHCFMEDKQGYFWLSTNKGLYRVAKKELDSYALGNKENVFYYYFDKSSGFASNEFNGGCTPCGIVTHDGHFSLPSLNGLVLFKPDSVPVQLPEHPVFIDRMSADEKKVLRSDHFEQRQDAGPLVFVIASPYFGNQANLHLEYSIPQLDNQWRLVNNDAKLVLTGLHKGTYTLIVRKQERYKQYDYKTITWTILPYWYETIWFKLLVSIIAIGILFFIFWLRYARAVKRAELLEQKVAERTEALLASNRVKEKMIAVILHDLRSPLRFLHIMAIHIYENYQKLSQPELSENLVKVKNATHDLYEFTQDFLIWTNAQKEGFVTRQEKIILRDIVGGIISLYEPAAAIRNNIVLNLIPPDITLVSDSNILKLIIRNLADNANKYTVNGEIKMEAVQYAGEVRIIISDTGKSMEKDLVTAILNKTYQGDNDSHGFGYKIIHELLARIHGELTIDQPGETGNRITLIFKY
jgi:signal transduction histidine kinase